MLRHFGFTNELDMCEPVLDYQIREGQTIELSDFATKFLEDLFEQYSRGKAFLAYDDLEDIFSTTNSPLWAACRSDESAWLSIEKLIATGKDF